MVDEASDYLKNEEENDPAKVQKEAVELQREGIRLMKEAMAKKPPGPSYIAAADYITGPPQKFPMEFQVRKIENGWILASKADGRHGLGPYDRTSEIYCQTAEELVKAAAAQVKAFTEEKEGNGAPAYPPPFQLEPGEAP
jgi:hypothetical protein